jgi:serine/threonine protein kinase
VISFACTHCGHQLQLRDDFAGKRGKCPQCKQLLTVPLACGTPAEAPALSVDAASAAATLPPTGPGVLDRKTLAPNPRQREQAPASDTLRLRGAGEIPPGAYDFLSPAQQPDEIGRLGIYRVLRVLGVGGMGVVFHAEDTILHRPVALKAMLPALAANPANKERFLREARAAAGLEHDHIVTIHQVGEDNGVPFMAMPLLRGESLEDRLQRDGTLPLPEVLRIGRETADGLAAAAERGLVHRDIKPANIWLEGERRRVKILDFGLARGTSDDAHLTQQGVILGTPAYMAPEQCGGKPVDARCDLFSLGCVLYRLSTGQLPFIGDDTVSTLLAVATQQAHDPRTINAAIPASLSRLILSLLAKNPADRPASAREVSEALAAIEGDPALTGPSLVEEVVPLITEPVRRPRVEREDDRTIEEVRPIARSSSRTPARRPSRRGRPSAWPWILGGAGALLVVVLGGVFVALAIRPGSATTSPASNLVVQQPPPTSAPVFLPPPTRPPATRPVEPPPNLTPSKIIAAWVIKHHGTIGVQTTDGKTYLTNGVPNEPFRLIDILLSNNKDITDREIGGIVNALEGMELRWVYLDGTSVSDTTARVFSRRVKKLDAIFLKGTRVTDRGVRSLADALPGCNIQR